MHFGHSPLDTLNVNRITNLNYLITTKRTKDKIIIKHFSKSRPIKKKKKKREFTLLYTFYISPRLPEVTRTYSAVENTVYEGHENH